MLVIKVNAITSVWWFVDDLIDPLGNYTYSVSIYQGAL